tara:strand:- start:167 stop:379 length:213 start_codon:yes stop_codon:yes gene_type:complete
MADTKPPRNKMYHLYLKVDKLKEENKKLNQLLGIDEKLMSKLARENNELFQNQLNCKKLTSSRQHIKYTI